MAKYNSFGLLPCLVAFTHALPQAITPNSEPAIFPANPNVGPGGSNFVDSNHFRLYNSSSTAAAQTGLNLLEAAYDCFVTKLKYRSPGLSINAADDNGPWQKTNGYVFESLGTSAGFLRVDEATGYAFFDIVDELLTNPFQALVTVHEYGHVVHYHQKNWINQGNTGAWWETFAEWFADTAGTSSMCADARQAHGVETRGIDINLDKLMSNSHKIIVDGTAATDNHYEAWPFFTYLTNNPDNFTGLGQDTIRQLNLQYAVDSNETPLHTLNRISTGADAGQVVSQYWARMAFVDIGHPSANSLFLEQRSTINYDNLDSQGGGSYRVKPSRAPQYMGCNFIPLTTPAITSGTTSVSATVSAQRDLIATFSIRNRNSGSVRYVVLRDGSGSVDVSFDEEITLVVVNAPVVPILYDPFNPNSEVTIGLDYNLTVSGATA